MMRFGKLGIMALVLVLLVTLVAGCGQTGDKDTDKNKTEEFKVGFIYIGAPGDAGWTYAHDQGRKYLEEKIPEVKSMTLEYVPEGGDAERSIEQLAQEGCKVIIANSLVMGIRFWKLLRYPDITFLHCSGLKTDTNVSTYLVVFIKLVI